MSEQNPSGVITEAPPQTPFEQIDHQGSAWSASGDDIFVVAGGQKHAPTDDEQDFPGLIVDKPRQPDLPPSVIVPPDRSELANRLESDAKKADAWADLATLPGTICDDFGFGEICSGLDGAIEEAREEADALHQSAAYLRDGPDGLKEELERQQWGNDARALIDAIPETGLPVVDRFINYAGEPIKVGADYLMHDYGELIMEPTEAAARWVAEGLRRRFPDAVEGMEDSEFIEEIGKVYRGAQQKKEKKATDREKEINDGIYGASGKSGASGQAGATGSAGQAGVAASVAASAAPGGIASLAGLGAGGGGATVEVKDGGIMITRGGGGGGGNSAGAAALAIPSSGTSGADAAGNTPTDSAPSDSAESDSAGQTTGETGRPTNSPDASDHGKWPNRQDDLIAPEKLESPSDRAGAYKIIQDRCNEAGVDTRFPAAAGQVSSDVELLTNLSTDDVDDHLYDISEQLYEHNYDVFGRLCGEGELFDPMDTIPDHLRRPEDGQVDPTTGPEFDLRMVEAEQRLVTSYNDGLGERRDHIISELNNFFGGISKANWFFGSTKENTESLPHVLAVNLERHRLVTETIGAEIDFGNEEHRVTIGQAMIMMEHAPAPPFRLPLFIGDPPVGGFIIDPITGRPIFG